MNRYERLIFRATVAMTACEVVAVFGDKPVLAEASAMSLVTLAALAVAIEWEKGQARKAQAKRLEAKRTARARVTARNACENVASRR